MKFTTFLLLALAALIHVEAAEEKTKAIIGQETEQKLRGLGSINMVSALDDDGSLARLSWRLLNGALILTRYKQFSFSTARTTERS